MTQPLPSSAMSPNVPFLARFTALLCASLLVTGCAAWKVDKSIQADPEAVQQMARKADQVKRFHQAVYEVSTFAAERCDTQTMREPFMLVTLGQFTNVYSAEQVATVWHASGWDENWRVAWAHPTSPIKEGERVVEINGNKIENNKTGMGEWPLVKYFYRNYSAREDAADGEPYRVTMEDGREIDVPMVPGCRAQVWAVPVFDDEPNSFLPRTYTEAVILPATAINLASNDDERRYLAGLAMYFGAGAETNRNRTVATTVVAVNASATAAIGVLAVPLFPLVYGVLSPVTLMLQKAITGSADIVQASIFATGIVADMGGDPYAGLTLIERLEQAKLGAERVILEPEDRQLVQQFIQERYQSGPKETAVCCPEPPTKTAN